MKLARFARPGEDLAEGSDTIKPVKPDTITKSLASRRGLIGRLPPKAET